MVILESIRPPPPSPPPPPDVEVQWCSQGDLLAVAGMERHPADPEPACAPVARNALVKFYNVQGEHIYTLETPAQVATTMHRLTPLALVSFIVLVRKQVWTQEVTS